MRGRSLIVSCMMSKVKVIVTNNKEKMCVRILNNIQQMGLQSNLNLKTKRKISVDYKVMWSKFKVKVNKDNVTV